MEKRTASVKIMKCTLQCYRVGDASDAERHLVEELFDRQNYNPMIRPVKNLSDTIEVRFEMTLIQLIMLVCIDRPCISITICRPIEIHGSLLDAINIYGN